MSGKISGDSRRAVLHRLERTGTVSGELLYQNAFQRGGTLTILTLDEWDQNREYLKQTFSVGNFPFIRTTEMIATRIRSMLEQLSGKNVTPANWREKIQVEILDPQNMKAAPVIQQSRVRRTGGNRLEILTLDQWAQKQEQFQQMASVGNFPVVVTTNLIASRIRAKLEAWASKNLIANDWRQRLKLEITDGVVAVSNSEITNSPGVVAVSETPLPDDVYLEGPKFKLLRTPQEVLNELNNPDFVEGLKQMADNVAVPRELFEPTAPEKEAPVIQESRKPARKQEVQRGPAGINAFEGYENEENTKPGDLRGSLLDNIRAKTPKVQLTEWMPGQESPIANDTVSNDTQSDVSPAGPNLFE